MFLSSTTSPEPAVPGPSTSSRSPTCIRLSLLSQPAETISSQTQDSCSPNVELSSSVSPSNTQASPEAEVTATATSQTISDSTSNSVCYAPNSSNQSDKIDSSHAETSSPVTAVALSVATVSHSASVDSPPVPASDTLSIVSHVSPISHSPGALNMLSDDMPTTVLSKSPASLNLPISTTTCLTVIPDPASKTSLTSEVPVVLFSDISRSPSYVSPSVTDILQ